MLTSILIASALAFAIGWMSCTFFVVGPLRASRDAWKARADDCEAAYIKARAKLEKIKELTK